MDNFKMAIMYFIAMLICMVCYYLLDDSVYRILSGVFLILIYLEGVFNKLNLISKQNELIILMAGNIQKVVEK